MKLGELEGIRWRRKTGLTPPRAIARDSAAGASTLPMNCTPRKMKAELQGGPKKFRVLLAQAFCSAHPQALLPRTKPDQQPRPGFHPLACRGFSQRLRRRRHRHPRTTAIFLKQHLHPTSPDIDLAKTIIQLTPAPMTTMVRRENPGALRRSESQKRAKREKKNVRSLKRIHRAFSPAGNAVQPKLQSRRKEVERPASHPNSRGSNIARPFIKVSSQ